MVDIKTISRRSVAFIFTLCIYSKEADPFKYLTILYSIWKANSIHRGVKSFVKPQAEVILKKKFNNM